MSASRNAAIAKPEPHRHPRRIRAHRPVDRVLELGERDDLVEARLDVGAAETLDRTVQEHVLAPGEVEVEARAELEQRADSAFRCGRVPAVGLMIPATTRSSVVLPEPLRPIRPTASPLRDLGRDVVERPHVGGVVLAAVDDEILERARLARVDAKAARDALDGDLANLHAA